MTAQELKKSHPDVFFVKTRKFIDKPSYQLVKESYIPEDDSPFPSREQLSEKTRLYPLSITAYPNVLRRMSAMEAGAWAVTKCRQQKWELTLDNFQCCLANLEMDF